VIREVGGKLIIKAPKWVEGLVEKQMITKLYMLVYLRIKYAGIDVDW
jgi:hypothetical protein